MVQLFQKISPDYSLQRSNLTLKRNLVFLQKDYDTFLMNNKT